jgi:prepilin-type N-terminal cleavage/methylation domain-containing protein/prepilin-type processing-associated H-X9-DG protein
MRRHGRGFTLIELLVVVGVLAILAALLFPVLSSARARARTAACQSNLKQIGAGITLYLGDWDEYLPYACVSSDCLVIQNGIAPYLQKRGGGVWVCPGDPSRELSEEDQRGIVFYGVPRGSYWGYEGLFGAAGYPCEDRQLQVGPRAITSVERPADAIMMVEGYAMGSGLHAMSADVLSQFARFHRGRAVDHEYWNLPHIAAHYTGLWHRGRGNYLFADGHVKRLTVRQTLQPRDKWEDWLDWCPDCSCASVPDRTQQDADRLVRMLDEAGYP